MAQGVHAPFVCVGRRSDLALLGGEIVDGKGAGFEETRVRRGRPAPAAGGEPSSRVLPMELKLGDRLVDATGEWEVAGRPYVTNGGKTTHVRLQPHVPSAS
jgi:hypothetical protein